jgi:signal transduction histidine kinase
MQARVEPFSVPELARLVVEDGRALARGRSTVDFSLELGPDVSDMCSDETKVRQILTNLVGNAVKFTDGGSVVLSIEHLADDIVFRVKDSGIGIAAEQQAIIFEPFRQAKGADRRAISGTGLGLAIVKRLTDLLGGTVTVHSVVGEGTEFAVTLPRQSARSDGENPDHR